MGTLQHGRRSDGKTNDVASHDNIRVRRCNPMEGEPTESIKRAALHVKLERNRKIETIFSDTYIRRNASAGLIIMHDG